MTNILTNPLVLNKRIYLFLFVFLNFISIHSFAQQKHYTVADAHAHNDYEHPVPFHTAFNAGFGSIEADVFPVNGVLLVAHSKTALQFKNTLRDLYLDPLLQELKHNKDRKVSLLIDVKENYKLSLQLLTKELEPLKNYLFSYHDKSKPVTILISGERPPPSEYKNYPDYIYFDDDLRLHHSAQEWKRVGLVSLSFERYSSWKGEGVLPEKDKDVLGNVIDSVHQSGKKIRFWAAPDNENSWTTQMKLGADFIGTDKIKQLSEFLEKK
ncbi:MAG: phosphatidylinositol-specific phospholipase C/glycerophosphodiester phosphodiesterase family protein [Ginsengibacter sp.]